MNDTEAIRVVERMRELLADPDRVVLDPMHYFEREANGTVREMDWDEALKRRDTCRVCFCGAASMAAYEVCGDGDGYADEDADNEVRRLIADKSRDLAIPLDREAERAYFGDNEVSRLTSALKQGRAVEVCDAVLADLRASVAA